MSVRRGDYDFDLPADRIAQSGAEPRDASRLLVVPGGGAPLEHRVFRDLPELLRAGDLLVLNESRVMPARLEARKPTGARLEVLLLRELSLGRWTAFVRNARRLAPDGELLFGPEGAPALRARVADELEDGARVLEFDADPRPHLARLGELPLPPYVTAAVAGERYQTVYARAEGSVAAPTAGLHFTPELLERVRALGVEVRSLVLHVGAGTFKPIEGDPDEHVMHEESFEVPAATAEAVRCARAEGRRVVAVGTTVVRALEAAWDDRLAGPRPGPGETRLFVRPPYRFRAPDLLVTNFHLPRSTLLMLVAAFAGLDVVRHAYEVAVREGYRFYSLGDAMLLYRQPDA